MDLRLFSVEQMPRVVPNWDLMLDDLGRPPPERVARALGVSRTSVYRWNARGSGPKVAALALFWLTRWGRSAIHAQAVNDAIQACGLARCLSEERQVLTNRVDDLERQLRQLGHLPTPANRGVSGAPVLSWPAIEPAPGVLP